MTEKRLVILGFASSSRDLAPVKSDTVEVWSLNHAYSFLGDAWTRWLEIHPMEHVLKDIRGSGNAHLEWLSRDHKRPIYMQKHYDEIPCSVPWPREEINAWFASLGDNKVGFYASDYYGSTISEALALAMWEHATGKQKWIDIGIYGVDLLEAAEYQYQRPSAEYMIGFARGLGLKVYVPSQSAMCKLSYTYGYTEPPDDGVYTPYLNFLAAQRDKAEAKRVEIQAIYHTMHGAVQMADLALKALTDTGVTEGPGVEKLKAERESAQAKAQEHAKAAIALEAQRSTLEATVSWGKEVARGGVLNA